jgi:hypothetical protein
LCGEREDSEREEEAAARGATATLGGGADASRASSLEAFKNANALSLVASRPNPTATPLLETLLDHTHYSITAFR